MIKYDEVTTLSKILAVIFFIGVLPVWAFYLGTEYQRVIDLTNGIPVLSTYIDIKTPVSTVSTTTNFVTKAGLRIGETKSISGIDITLNDIVEDSRCPLDVQCIQAGRVLADVTLKENTTSSTVQISSDKPYVFGLYTISITDIHPDNFSQDPTEKSEYRLDFSVEKDSV